MKKSIIYLVFLMLCPFLMGQNLQVLQNTYNKVAVSFYPGEISVEDISVPSGDFSRISIVDYGSSYNPGAPQLPMLTKLLQIPVCDSVVVSIVDAKYEEYSAADLGIAHALYPCQPSVSKSASVPPFAYNQALYSTDELYALPLVSAQIAGIKRNCALANIFVSPVQYNPVAQTIRIYTRIDVEFTFANADMASTNQLRKYDSPLFDLSKDMVINKMYNPTKASSTAPVKYLIIANSMFANSTDLADFVAWKRRLGYLVEIAYTSDASVGTTTTSIKNYIQNKYNNATSADPAPTYLLLIGDTDQIPTYTSRVEPEDSDGNENNNETHVTDLYYATLAGGDNLPDCYYGRLSATSTTQLSSQLAKIMMYEQYTMPDPSYLGKAVLIAGTDSYWSTTHADGQINYAYNNYVNTNSTTHSFTNVKKYNYNSSSQAATIRSEIGAGAGFVNYTAHGDVDRWQDPEFTSTQVSQMSNANKYGLMIGNCCLSGSFQESACFAETVMRAANKGAMGYIGASKETYWDQDVYWAVGMRNSISASMSYSASNLGMYDKLFHTHGENYSNWVSTIGGIVQGGGMSVQNSSSSSDYKTYYWEIYHCFGDPSVMVYLGMPSTMTVSSSDVVTSDIDSYTAQVPPYAYVALTSSGELISAAYANANGYVSLPISGQLPMDDLELAVTAQNYIPYFKTIEVQEPNLDCPRPADLAASNITAHTAALSWTNNSTANSFNIRYKESGESEPIVTEVTSQNFEGGSMPAGWTSEGSASWLVGTGDYSSGTGAHGGSYNARITHGTSGNTTYLVMPAIDLSEANNATLTFWFVNRSWSGDIDEFGVYYRVSGGAWTELWSTTEAHSTWTQQSVSLSGLAANYQIGFKFTDRYGYGIGLDDIVITSAQMSSAHEWVTSTSNTASAMLTGLAAETEYEVQVQANCGNDGNSSWTSAFFTTTEACPAPAEVTVSNVGPNSASLSWTGNGDSYNVRYRIAEDATTVFSDDFENGIGNWTILDADGDGFNWESHINTGSGNFVTHAGDGCAVSASYDNDSQVALTPNNWLITPQVQLGGTVSFWAAGQVEQWAAEHFAVYVSTTGTNPSNFTQVSEEFVATGTYTQYTVDLSAYSGMGYVAIRHFNVTDMFYLNIDDFTITMNVGTGEWATVTTNTASATLTGLAVDSPYEVQVQADCGNEGSSSWTTATFTTTESCPAPTDFTNLAVGPNTATIGWTGYSNSYNVRYRTAGGDAVTFEDGFENGLGNWTIYTEGDYLSDYFSEGWFPYDASEMSFGNHTGNAVALSCSWYSNALEADNWLITPQINLKGTLRFWVYSNYSDEYEVLLSTSGNQINNFNVTLKSMAAAPSSWTEVTIDLSNYNGQLGYIAIHHDFTDGQWLAFDDFSISDSQDAGQWVETTTSTNSLDISGLNPETEYEIQVQLFCADGGTSRWASYTFTTTESCPVPTNLITSDITASTATLNWTGYSDSYNVRYRKSPIYFENFENGMPDGWTTIDNDGDGNNWYLFTPADPMDDNNNPTVIGSSCVTSASYLNDPLTPDNWLITPKIDLQGVLKVWLRGQDPAWASEHFAIYLSTSGNAISDFTTTLLAETIATDEYVQYTADLSAYAGQQGYIAIRHFNITDMFRLNLDDFGIFVGDGEWQTVNNASMPATISDLEPETEYDWQVQSVCDGSMIDWSEIVTFETEELVDNTYTIWLNQPNVGGIISANVTTAHEGDVITLSATPEAGYIFKEWSVTLANTPSMVNVPVSADNTFEMPANDVNVAAVFVPDTFSVTFVTNGGTLPSDVIDHYYYGQVPDLPIPIYEGHEFLGWHEDASLEGNAWYWIPDTAKHDKIYYAKWEANIYSVTTSVYPSNAGSITGLNESGNYEHGSTLTLTAVPVEGFDFLGWWINHENIASSTNPTYETTVTGDIYAEARFGLHAYTITVIQPAAGGTVMAMISNDETMVTITESGTSIMGNWIQLDYEIDEGYFFDGFVVTDADNNEIETPNNGFEMPASDVTITAVFTAMGQVATPSFSPAPDTYDSEHIPIVTISCSTPGATIHYTTDGTEPTVNSPVYTEPLTITGTTTIMAMAEADNMMNSEVAVATYTIDQVYYVFVNGNLFNGTITATPTSGVAGTQVTLSATSEDGYVFKEWLVTLSNAPTLVTIPVTGNTFEMPASDVNVSAVFVPDTFGVSFVLNGGEFAEGYTPVSSYWYGQTGVMLPTSDDMVYAGHTFGGWYETPELTGNSWTMVPDTAMSDKTYYAKWTINTYTVTAVVSPQDGGEITGLNESGEYEYGSVVTLTAVPAEGYDFTGWWINHENMASSTDPAYETTVTGDIYAEARFELHAYTITVTQPVAGGTVAAQVEGDETVITEIGTSVMGNWVQLTYEAAEGYLFSGFVVTDADNNEIETPNNGFVMPASDVTITAVFVPQNFTITYMDGNTLLHRDTLAYGSSVTPFADPSKEGYIFTGWEPVVPLTMPAEHLTINAQWVPDTFGVSFVLNGAEFADGYTPVNSYWYGQPDVMLPTSDDMVYAGHTFGGWYETPELTGNSWTMVPDTAMSDKTYYAKWTINTYTVTAVVSPQDGGEITGLNESGEYEYGSVVTLTAVPAEGYDFTGWWINHENMSSSTDPVYETMVTGDIYAEARFELHEYTITVNQPAVGGTVAAQVEGNETVITESGISVMGNWVQLTYEAAEDYLFDRFVVMDADNNEIETPNNGFIMPASDVTITAVFTAMGQVATPSFSPAPGTYDSEHIPMVTISCSTPGATIHYTTDGTEPTVNSPVYTEPLTITGTTTIMAMAEADNMMNSEVAVATYTIDQVYYVFVNGNISNGTITATPTSGVAGTQITLGATPEAGYIFDSWIVSLVGTPAMVTIPVTGNTFEMPASDVNVSAVFVPDTFGVSFVLNGAEFADGYTPVNSYWYGQPDVMLPTSDDMVYAGHTFGGWYETPELTGNSWTMVPDTAMSDKTYYAKWTINTYTVTAVVSPQDGGEITGLNESGEYEYGSVVTLTAVPAEGYDFTGWWINHENMSSSTDPVYETMVTGDIYAEARFELHEYTITVNQPAVGGTVAAQVEGDETVITEIGTSVMGNWVQLTYEAAEDYLFSGFVVVDVNNNEIETPNNGFVMPASDVIVTAVFTAMGQVATPSFSPAPGTYDSEHIPMVTISCSTPGATIHYTTDGTEPTIDSPVYTEPLTITGTTTIMAMAEADNMVNSAVAMAIYTIDQVYTINVNADIANGTVDVNPTTGTEGTVITLDPIPDEGYTFGGWNVTDGSGEVIPVSEDNTFELPAGDVNIDAVFVPDTFSVSFVLNGAEFAEGYMPVSSYWYGQTGVMLPTSDNMVYAGHTFGGWYEAPDLAGNSWTMVPDTAMSDKTYYAKWTINTYTVTAVVSPQDGGEITGLNESGEYEYGSVVTLTAVPAEGYDFTGWWINHENMASSTDPVYETMVTGDIYAEARFELHEYTITVNQPAVGGTVAAQVEGGETVITETGTSVMGNWVQLTYEAAEDYLFDRFVVTDADNNEIETPNNGFVMLASDVTITAVFTAMGQVATPSFSPTPGTYSSDQDLVVTISCSTPGATIHYTTDGTEPTVDSPVYTEPLTIMGTTTIMAMAEADNMVNSAVATATYTIDQVYTINVNADIANGTVVVNPTTGTEGTVITLNPIPDEGYTFGGWNVTDGSGEEIPVGEDNTFVLPAGDVNIDAVFVPDTFGVSFVLNGAEFAEDYTPVSSYWYGQSGVMLPTSDDMVYAGHTFGGWYETPELTGNSWTMVPDTAMSDKTYYAKWTINTYTVAAVVSPQDGGEITGLNESGEYEYGSVVTLTAVPAEGYDFTGWWINHENMASSTDPVYETMVTGDIYAEARFELHAYTITVTQPVAGGTVAAQVEGDETVITESGTSVMGNWVQLTYEAAEDYSFDRFVVTDADNNEIETPNNGFEMPASDMTITAVFTAMGQVATPSFSPAPGTYDSEHIPMVTINCSTPGATIHYTTDGTEPTVDSPVYTEPLTLTGTTTIKAMAEADNMVNSAVATATYTIDQVYTINVNADIANGTVVVNPTTGTEGTVITLNPIPDEGYTFGGWNVTDGSGEEIPVGEDNTFELPAGDVNIDAVFVPMTYSLTLEVGQGTLLNGFVRDTSYTYGEGFVLPTAADVEYAGHIFAGWYTNMEYAGNPITEISADATGDTTVYAKWNTNIMMYNITTSVSPAGTGTVTATPTTAVEGTVVALTATPATGYTFNGWSVTWVNNGVEEEILVNDDNTFEMPAGNVMVNAIFVPMTFNITLEIGEGTLLNGFVRDSTYTYGVGFSLPTVDDVEYAGHTFAGWYTNAEFTGDPITKISAFAMGDTTVYAKWDISTYTLTIHYVYETGVEAAPTFTQTMNDGEPYNVQSPEIETYMPSQSSVSGVMGEEDVEVTVIYTQIVMSDVAAQTVCAGGFTDNIVFSSPLSFGTMSYAWTNDVTSIGLAGSGEGNIASFDVVNTSSSPVTATITVTPTCTYNNMTVAGVPQTFTITVNPTSASEFSATAEDFYTWVEADTTITEEGTHDYVHVFTNRYGCDSVVTLHLTITVGIENYDLTSRVILYPNPAHDIINIDVEGDATVTGVEVFDVYGKVVRVVDCDNLPQAQQPSSINISHLVEGVYVVHIRTDKGVATKKFVKH